jgi:hypothetical protein
MPPGIEPSHRHYRWPVLLGLVGLDYFSTLAYQPSIAAEFAGPLAPLATAALVLVTLLAALPVYAYVARRSPPWQGSISMLERLIHGWRGKFLVLTLLGFAATNFVFTRTLSAADAAVHLVQNPIPEWQVQLDEWAASGGQFREWSSWGLWQSICNFWNRQMVITVILLLIGVFLWPLVWFGFTRPMIWLSALLVGAYLFLTVVIIGSGLTHVIGRTDLASTWWQQVTRGEWCINAPHWAGTDGWSIAGMCLWLLPKMALGLSGFEMSLVVMPLVRGKPGDDPAKPAGQVTHTRRLLLCSALVMSTLLIGSALMTTILLGPAQLLAGGGAHERTLAYLAHGGSLVDGTPATAVNPLFGPTFGSIYDVLTVMVLCFAGASVSLGLRSMVPQYLSRFGMELEWAGMIGLIYLLFSGVNLVVTMVFRASVSAQRSAYATSVIVLLAAAALATSIDLARCRGWRRLLSLPFTAITLLFVWIAGAIVWANPSSILITLLFIVTIIVTSMLSRWWRSTEFRFEGFEFASPDAEQKWDAIRRWEISVLVPHRPGQFSISEKERMIRFRHRIPAEIPIIILMVDLGDTSDFSQRPLLNVCREEARDVLRVSRCVSVAHVIAAIGLEFSKVGEPPEIHFGWSEESPLSANLNFLLFGQGNVPWLVHDLLRRHEPDPTKRPHVIIG